MTTDLRAMLDRALGNPEFAAAMEQAAIAFPAYRSRLPMIPYAYTRTRLALMPEYEVIAMQWAPGAVSPIHDHGASRCWVLMLEGELDIENFERENAQGEPLVHLRAGERGALRPGDIDVRNGPRELHRVHNLGETGAFSLQLYAPAISAYSIIDEHSHQSRLVSAICDLTVDLADL